MPGVSFCRISGDLALSTRKSLVIAIVRFWCAKAIALHVLWEILCLKFDKGCLLFRCIVTHSAATGCIVAAALCSANHLPPLCLVVQGALGAADRSKHIKVYFP